MGAEISVKIKTKIEIEREIIISSKIIFFFFDGRYSISINIIRDFIIVISSASETLILEVGLICY